MTFQESTEHPGLLHDPWYATMIPDPIELDLFLRTFWDEPLDGTVEEKLKRKKEREQQQELEEATQDDQNDPSVWEQK
jgi:hypothetical protein